MNDQPKQITMTVPCSACDAPRARVKPGKNGTYSINCPECGSLTMVKSPKAVAALLKKLGVAEQPKPANATPFDDFIAKL